MTRVRQARLGTLLIGLVVLLAACGRVPPTASATSNPSPSPNESPTAVAPPLTITTPTLHLGEVGLAYPPVAFLATGGNDPFLWRVSDGELPGGMGMSLDGVISGTPTGAGAFNFMVEVTDASMAVAEAGGSIPIAPKLSVRYARDFGLDTETGLPLVGMCIGSRADHPCPPADNPSAQFGVAGGGVLPYTYALVSGTLPVGTALNGLALSWQRPSPCPTALIGGGCPEPHYGLYPISIAVRDSIGGRTVTSVELWLYWT